MIEINGIRSCHSPLSLLLMPSFSSGSMQVTISLLPVSLSLVHVPRSRLPQLSHPVLRQILQPSPTFLNITCNEIELSIFAEHQMLADFEKISRHDRQRQRSRSGSGSARKNDARGIPEPVEISYDRWNALQIDSHSDRIGELYSNVFQAYILYLGCKVRLGPVFMNFLHPWLLQASLFYISPRT